MITVDGLFKKYGKTQALNNASLHVSEGTIHGLIGPNGSGKSTTIKILSTLVRPNQGDVSIGGVPLKKGRAIRQQIGVVPETPRLHEYLTAQEEIMSYARLSGLGRARARDRVSAVIKQLDIGMVQNQKISRFSTGMKKRVALALAMVADPPVLLLDEPMSGLDPVVRGSSRTLSWDWKARPYWYQTTTYTPLMNYVPVSPSCNKVERSSKITSIHSGKRWVR